jgi:hypothetical protein
LRSNELIDFRGRRPLTGLVHEWNPATKGRSRKVAVGLNARRGIATRSEGKHKALHHRARGSVAATKCTCAPRTAGVSFQAQT